jgi:hypothetical protein
MDEEGRQVDEEARQTWGGWAGLDEEVGQPRQIPACMPNKGLDSERFRCWGWAWTACCFLPAGVPSASPLLVVFSDFFVAGDGAPASCLGFKILCLGFS